MTQITLSVFTFRVPGSTYELGPGSRVPGLTYKMGPGSRVPPEVPDLESHFLDMPETFALCPAVTYFIFYLFLSLCTLLLHLTISILIATWSTFMFFKYSSIWTLKLSEFSFLS